MSLTFGHQAGQQARCVRQGYRWHAHGETQMLPRATLHASRAPNAILILFYCRFGRWRMYPWGPTLSPCVPSSSLKCASYHVDPAHAPLYSGSRPPFNLFQPSFTVACFRLQLRAFLGLRHFLTLLHSAAKCRRHARASCHWNLTCACGYWCSKDTRWELPPNSCSIRLLARILCPSRIYS